MSARIGADPLLVQGPGGNSSIKDEDEIWIKASGQWLAEAEQHPIFVPLARSRLHDDNGRPLDEVPASAVISARNEAGLRPSIETMLHAIMPHRIVVHAHAVNAMTISVLADGEARASERLEGLSWRWVPYHRPGAPLARAVVEALSSSPVDILILQNHGVVVGAGDVEMAEAMLAEVEQRLTLPASNSPVAPGRIEGDAAFEHDELVSAWSCDPAIVDVLTRYTLVPDQVVFLGGPIPIWRAEETPSVAAARVERETGIVPALLLRPGIGAVAARSRTSATAAMIEGMIEVARRIPDGAAVLGLSAADVAELTGWDAEHYRKSIDAARA